MRVCQGLHTVQRLRPAREEDERLACKKKPTAAVCLFEISMSKRPRADDTSKGLRIWIFGGMRGDWLGSVVI